jgi:hypothetical protein
VEEVKLAMKGLRNAPARKTFPGEVRRTADPSASLGMTKGRVALPRRIVTTGRELRILHPVTDAQGKCCPPFVIPSEAEGSAVLRTSPGNVFLNQQRTEP